MQELKNRIAIVTGGTKGIGRAIATALLQEGATVAICSRNDSEVSQTVQELSVAGKIIGRACNVGSWEDVSDYFSWIDQEFQCLDILVNNAGIGLFAPVEEISPEEWCNVIETNLNGPFFCSRQAIPRMKKWGGGFILNIGSLAGKNPFAGGTAYNASKFGLNGFSEALMMDLRFANIRVSQIMPGSVQTGFSSSVEDADWKLDPAEIAATAMHLLKMPPRNLASRVEMRPSQPKRSSR